MELVTNGLPMNECNRNQNKQTKELKIFPSDDKALSHRQCMALPQLLSETQAHPFRAASVACFTLPLSQGGPQGFVWNIPARENVKS